VPKLSAKEAKAELDAKLAMYLKEKYSKMQEKKQ